MRVVRHALVAIAIAAVCVPVAFVGTFALLPLWRWIEARWGIESVGHSGPADWCFWTVYALGVAGGLALALVVARAAGPRSDDSPVPSDERR